MEILELKFAITSLSGEQYSQLKKSIGFHCRRKLYRIWDQNISSVSM